MKTFIVFGANGFIGSNLVDQLSKSNRVIAVDKYVSKPTFKVNKNVNTVVGDIFDSVNLLKILKKIRADGVVWAVGGMIPADQSKDEDVVISGVNKQIDLLKNFVVLKIPVILTSSAGMLYSGSGLFTEYSKVSPWTVYGKEKKLMEESLINYSKKFNNDKVRVVRISSVYGQRQPTNRDQGVVGKIIASLLKGEEFPLYGSDLAERDYIYVKDLVLILEKLLVGHFKYRIYNVSTGKSNSLKEIINIVEKETKLKLRVSRQPKRNIDPTNIKISNKKLKREIGKFEFTPLDKGLGQTIEWFRKNL